LIDPRLEIDRGETRSDRGLFHSYDRSSRDRHSALARRLAIVDARPNAPRHPAERLPRHDASHRTHARISPRTPVVDRRSSHRRREIIWRFETCTQRLAARAMSQRSRTYSHSLARIGIICAHDRSTATHVPSLFVHPLAISDEFQAQRAGASPSRCHDQSSSPTAQPCAMHVHSASRTQVPKIPQCATT
jgi:hypothetical protein